MTLTKEGLQKTMDDEVAAGRLVKLPSGRYLRYPFEQLFFAFFAKDDGLRARQYLTLEAAKEDCAGLWEAGFVTCIVPVSVDQTFWWNGENKTEHPVGELREQLVLAHEMQDAGVPLDTRKKNKLKGSPVLRRSGEIPHE